MKHKVALKARSKAKHTMKNKLVFDKVAIELKKEGWLKISSVNFLDRLRFPYVPVKKGEYKEVGVDFKAEEGPKNANPAAKDPTNLTEKLSQTTEATKENQNLYGQSQISDGFWRTNEAGGPTKNSFYFRLTNGSLYYTEGQSPMGPYCFSVSDLEKDNWDLCCDSLEEKKTWVCELNKILGKPCDDNAQITLIHRAVIKEPIFIIPVPSPHCDENWDYSRHGQDWKCMCTEGYQQSPIDICTFNGVNETSKSASFQFLDAPVEQFNAVFENNLLRIKCDNDECQGFGSVVDSDFTSYQLRELIIHTPGEHRIDGKPFDMEVQVIGYPTSQSDYSSKMVLAFLFEQTPGAKNKFIDSLEVINLPNKYDPKKKFSDIYSPIDTFKDGRTVNLENMFYTDHPDDSSNEFVNNVYSGYFSYFSYNGSLTTPGCEERVKWIVMRDPLHIGYATLEMLKDAFKSSKDNPIMEENNSPFFSFAKKQNPLMQSMDNQMLMTAGPFGYTDGNNRATQQLNGRFVNYFNLDKSECYPKPEKKESRGHYEKISVKSTQYVYVPTPEPSGLPNSFIVGEGEALDKRKFSRRRRR